METPNIKSHSFAKIINKIEIRRKRVKEVEDMRIQTVYKQIEVPINRKSGEKAILIC